MANLYSCLHTQTISFRAVFYFFISLLLSYFRIFSVIYPVTVVCVLTTKVKKNLLLSQK